MSGFAARPLPERRPRDVPGYAPAAAAGQVPVVPTTAPALLPGATAQGVFRSFLLKGAVAVLVLVVVLRVAAAVGLSSPALDLAVLGSIALVLCLLWRWWGRIGRRNLTELEHGYTTLVLQFGGFGRSEGRRWKGVGHRAPWDYAGLWVLDGSTGRVVSPPDRSVEPPGFYPSPNRPSAFELWSGVVWTGHYRAR